MSKITVNEYIDIIEDLYNIPLDVKTDMLNHKDEIEYRLIGYSKDELRSVVQRYFLTVDKRFFPKLGGLALMLESMHGNFSNPQPLDKKFYQVEYQTRAEFEERISDAYSIWWNNNPYYKSRIKAIKDEEFKPAYWGQSQKVLKMASELAEEIWEHRDSEEIKNSPVDPNLWALCRFKIDTSVETSKFFIIGSFLRKMWLAEKKVNSD